MQGAVSIWTVQQYLRHHADAIRPCGFLPVTNRFFQPLYASGLLVLASRREMQLGITRHLTDAWVAQQRRAATPYGARPRSLIRDNDSQCSQYGRACAQAATGIAELHTAYRAEAEGDRRALPGKRPPRMRRSRLGPGRRAAAAQPAVRAVPVLEGVYHPYQHAV